MKINLELTQDEVKLGIKGALQLGYQSFREAIMTETLRRPGEPNLLLDMLTAEARELGVPVPPLREVARALAPVIREELRAAKNHRAKIREELERWHNLMHNRMGRVLTPKKDDA